ncbi:DNA polymerase I [compost metagenome]
MTEQAVLNVIDVISYAEHVVAQNLPERDATRLICSLFRASIKFNKPNMAIVLFPNKEYALNKWGEKVLGSLNDSMAIAEAMGLRTFSCENANSFMISLKELGILESKSTIVSTSNLLLTRYVSDSLSVENLVVGDLVTNSNIIKKVGVIPEYIPSLLSMVGDEHNDIPKVPKVGFRNAIKWISEIGDVDKILSSGDIVFGASATELFKNKSVIFESISKMNNGINNLSFSDSDLMRRKINVEQLYPLYIKGEMYEWLPDDIKEQYLANSISEIGAISSKTIKNSIELSDLLSELSVSKSFSIYFEKNKENSLLGAGISTRDDNGYYIPFSHNGGSNSDINEEFFFSKAKDLLESSAVKKVSFDSKNLFKALSLHDITIGGFSSDLDTLVYTLNTRDSFASYDELIVEKMGVSSRKLSSFRGNDGQKVSDITDLEAKDAELFVCEKACMILKANKHFYLAASRNHGVANNYRKYELPLIPVLAKMEDDGIFINKNLLIEAGAGFERRMTEIRTILSDFNGEALNPDSPEQISNLLYTKLSLPITMKTSAGVASTSEGALKAISSLHEAPALITEYRSLSKLKSSYVDSLLKKISPITGRLHTSFFQTVTGTGRLSSRDPNLQNIPIKTENGRKIRQAFIPSNGNYLISADYSQIELRILAHLSGDEGLIKAFKAGADIHQATASAVFGIPIEQVTPTQRRSAKAINFGIIYGISAMGLAEDLGISRYEANSFISAYFSKYPGVSRYLEGLKKSALIDGYVTTISGRKIYVNKNIDTSTQSGVRSVERAAMNAPMQGSAAEIIKLAMININKFLFENKMKSKLLLQIHDELVIDSPPDEVKTIREAVGRIMSQSMDLLIPLVVDIEIGKNLDQSHGLEVKEKVNVVAI